LSELNRSKVLAIVPARGKDFEHEGEPVMLNGKPLIGYTLEAAMACENIERIVVTTDSPNIRQLSIELGAEAPFLRAEEMASPSVSLDQVINHCLELLESDQKYYPDVVMPLEASHPLRPDGLLDQVLFALEREQLDTVFTVYEERHAFWEFDDYGELHAVTQGEGNPRSSRRPIFREVAGLALASKSSVIRNGRRFGPNLGVIVVREPYAVIDTQDNLGLALAELVLRNGTDTS